MMNQIGQWTKSNQALAIVVVVVVGVLLGLAMWLGLDLSWVPGPLVASAGAISSGVIHEHHTYAHLHFDLHPAVSSSNFFLYSLYESQFCLCPHKFIQYH